MTSSFQTSGGFVLAIDFGGTKLDVATAAHDGRLLRSERLETRAAEGAHQAVERALACARELTARTSADTGGRCLAAAATSPGIVREDHVLLSPNVPGWGELGLPALLRDGLELDAVVTATDVKAATLAEARWGALRGADPAVFLNLGTGLAAGMLVGGTVLAGAHGAAGEIGYLLRGQHDDHGAADGRAPLEEHVGGRAIGERAGRLVGRPLSAADAFAHAGHDAAVRMVVHEALAELAVHVANLAVVLDPVRIAVGGGLMHQAELVLAALRRRVRQAAPFPPDVVAAEFLHDGALRGAVALALDAAAAQPGVAQPAARTAETTPTP